MSTITRQKRTPWSRRLTLLIACVAICGMAPGGEGTRRTWSFESDEPGKIAKGFANVVGQWEVAKDGDNHVLYQKAKNDDATFNVALAEGTSYRDIDLNVKLKVASTGGHGGSSGQSRGARWCRQMPTDERRLPIVDPSHLPRPLPYGDP